MRLAPMRFKDFTWPHNPESCTLEFRRRLAVHSVPFGACVLQDLGASYRVLRGNGAFAGADAYDQFRMLSDVFRQEGAGLLVHPIWHTERAFFAALAVTDEPLPDYVPYTFEFWEDWSDYAGGLKTPAAADSGNGNPAAAKTPSDYIVKKGDTLWGIAKQNGVSLAGLIAANPQIKNPNLIYPGGTVKIP